MRIKYLFILIISLFFIQPNTKAYSVGENILINEVLPDPEGTDAGKEWIEFKNPTNAPINLRGYKLENINLDSGSVRSTTLSEDFVIPENSLGVLTEGVLNDLIVSKLVVGSGKLNLYNSKAKIVLSSPIGSILHEFIYNEVKSGKSIESPGFPYCTKNVINENGNSVGSENFNSYTVCTDTLHGKFEYSKDGENWSSALDVYSQQMYIRFVPNDPIDISSLKIYEKTSENINAEIIQPIVSNVEKSIELHIKLRTSFTNNEYELDITITFGEPLPKMLFSLDSLSWSENIEADVRAGSLLYFKEVNGSPAKVKVNNEMYNSPYTIKADISSGLDFSIGTQDIKSETIRIRIIPELIISSAYPAPKSGESEYLIISNTSDFGISKDIYLTDNIDNPKQKKFSISLKGKEEIKISSPPSLNNSGDEIYLFVDDRLIDHIIYSQAESGDLFTRTHSSNRPVELKKPKVDITLISISEAKKSKKGSTVKVVGKVTYLDQSFGYIQDTTGGIRITGSLTALAVGKSYEILGEVSESLGEKKITGIETISETGFVNIINAAIDYKDLDKLVGSVIHGESDITANYSKSFKISENVSISLTGYEGFDRSKGDTIRFIGILSKGTADSFKIIPIELSLVESNVEGIQVSYPIAIIDPEKELGDTVEKIRSNGINSLVIGLGLVLLYFIYRFLKAKLDILMLKFSLWRESRKMQKSLSSERNMKSNIASVSS